VEDYRPDTVVEDIRQLAAHLNAERFILAGHDWGGAIAWLFANAHPELLEKLIIVNAPHQAAFARELATNPAQQEASQYMRWLRRAGCEEPLAENGFSRLFSTVEESSAGWIMTEEERALYADAWAQPGALTGMVNYYRASPMFPPAPGEPSTLADLIPKMDAVGMLQITVPTLVIWGEQDKALLTGCLDGLEQWVTDLTLHRISDASHWILHEQPERVNQLIREFLSR
jgi:pimeloyl-ACP methyl ester carboxylesterase